MGRAEKLNELEIRTYGGDDARATLSVFRAAITVTAADFYSPEQIAAWVGPEPADESSWSERRGGGTTLIAVWGRDVAGFADVDQSGFVDMLFVDPDYGRRGVATALLAALESRARAAGAPGLSANVSRAARRFFEHQGFTVVAAQRPVVRGVELINFRMVKSFTA